MGSRNDGNPLMSDIEATRLHAMILSDSMSDKSRKWRGENESYRLSLRQIHNLTLNMFNQRAHQGAPILDQMAQSSIHAGCIRAVNSVFRGQHSALRGLIKRDKALPGAPGGRVRQERVEFAAGVRLK